MGVHNPLSAHCGASAGSRIPTQPPAPTCECPLSVTPCCAAPAPGIPPSSCCPPPRGRRGLGVPSTSLILTQLTPGLQAWVSSQVSTSFVGFFFLFLFFQSFNFIKKFMIKNQPTKDAS